MPNRRSDELIDWVAGYAARAGGEESVTAFVTHVDDAIMELIPALAADPVLTAELHASTRSQFRAFLTLLDHEQQEVHLPPQARDLALSIARRNLGLGVLLKVYRVAQSSVWEYFTDVADEVGEGGPDRADVLVYLWDRAGSWINAAVEQLIAVYDAEREAALHGVLARRTDTIHALLRGDDIPVDAATTDLAHPLRGFQTALVLWTEDAPDDSLTTSATSAIAATVAAAVGAPRPLTAPAGRHDLWAWLSTTAEPEAQALRTAVDAALERASGHRIRVAFGSPAAGVDGFRASHREAVNAQRCVVGSGRNDAVTCYADVELVSLVSGNEDAARALVDRELGGLAADDPALDRVRLTVRRYLQLGGNVDAAASELIVHKNTVRYRLAQAESLIGHSLNERRTELDLALRYHDYALS